MWRPWWTYFLLLGKTIQTPSGSDVVQFMVDKETSSASTAVEDHHYLTDWRDEKGWSLLHYAALHGSSEVIQSLVKAGAKVDLKDLVKGVTPLMVAVEKENEEVLRTLIKAGADVNATDNVGVGVVVRARSSSMLQSLLSAGTDLDHRDSSGNTAVITWAREGRADVLMEALSLCPDLTLANHRGFTALDVAKMNNNVNATKVIEDKLQSLCVADGVYYPLLHTRYDGCYEVRCEAKCEWTRTGNTDPSCSDNINSRGKSRVPRDSSGHGSESDVAIQGKLVVTIHQTVRQAMCP